MKKPFFLPALLAFLLFLPAAVFAVSAQDAVNFVVKENSFLSDGEEFEQPLVPLIHDGKKFWVVPVISGDSIVTYFPVRQDAKVLSESRAVNRPVFRTADTLREVSFQKAEISKNPSIEWIFTPTYALRFSSLSGMLRNESYQLNTIASTVGSDEVYSLVSQMVPILESLSMTSASLSLLVSDASKEESTFFSAPDSSKIDSLKAKYFLVFEGVAVLDSKALDYREKVDELKQVISTDPQLEPSAKTYLISLADVPAEFNSIGSYLITSVELSSQIDSVYSRVSSRLDFLLNEFDLRIKKQSAFNAIYKENPSVVEKTDGEFSSVFEIVDFILKEENKSRWNASGLVRPLDSKWKETLKLYNERKYDLAESFSQALLSDALVIYRQGFFEEPIVSGNSNDFIFQVILGLLALLVLLLLYNNRDKLISFAKKKDDEEAFQSEVD